MSAMQSQPHPDAAGPTFRPWPQPLEGGWPAGYRVVVRRRALPAPDPGAAFLHLAEAILGWDLHRGSGLRVRADGPRAVPGAEVAVGVGAGPLRWYAPCRVLWSTEPVLDAAGQPVGGQRAGFGYAALPGHPASGHEGFYAELTETGQVSFAVAAYSRPANRVLRLGRPAVEAVQELITRRYFASAARLAGGN